MADIKLFSLAGSNVTELEGTCLNVEKSLQNLIESHLDSFLGIRFLASEYFTGKTHGGRIDTLGLDENGCPVIIEYKRASNENVINQGLFYLDWLFDHKDTFTILVMQKLDNKLADNVDWSNPRLLCIAGDFTKYDVHAVQQINRNIELIRYRKYGNNLLILELVNAVTSAQGPQEVGPKMSSGKTVSEYLDKADADLKDLFEALKAWLLALGDDVQLKEMKNYFAFKRIKNFSCVEVHPQLKKLVVYVKTDPSGITCEKGFTRDVSSIGHYGTGDLEITIASVADFERAKPLLEKSYEVS